MHAGHRTLARSGKGAANSRRPSYPKIFLTSASDTDHQRFRIERGKRIPDSPPASSPSFVNAESASVPSDLRTGAKTESPSSFLVEPSSPPSLVLNSRWPENPVFFMPLARELPVDANGSSSTPSRGRGTRQIVHRSVTSHRGKLESAAILEANNTEAQADAEGLMRVLSTEVQAIQESLTSNLSRFSRSLTEGAGSLASTTQSFATETTNRAAGFISSVVRELDADKSEALEFDRSRDQRTDDDDAYQSESTSLVGDFVVPMLRYVSSAIDDVDSKQEIDASTMQIAREAYSARNDSTLARQTRRQLRTEARGCCACPWRMRTTAWAT